MTTGIMDELEVSKIPTPNQIPAGIDLSQLPPHVLRSGAVEALANQNEDLIARLSVALRRTALLENQIAELENQQSTLAHQLSIAQDQALVLQEKDRRVAEKFQTQESILREATNQLQLLELQYTELYTTSREKQRQLSRHLKYRKKIKKTALALKRKMNSVLTQLRREEETSKELKARLGDSAARIMQISKDAELNQRQLVENYEKALKEVRDRVVELERQNSAFAEKTKDYEALFEKSVALENAKILTERRFTEFKAAKETEIQSLQSENCELRALNRNHILEIETLKRELAEGKSTATSQQDQIKKLIDQVETLQLLWQDGQAQQEKLTTKNQALQKLNQQLSTTVNQQRHEIQGLKHDLETQVLATSERIKEIKGHLQMIGQEGIGFTEANEPEPPARESYQVISKIDTLIAEIQSGFRRQTPEGTEPVAGDSSSSADNLGSLGTSNP